MMGERSWKGEKPVQVIAEVALLIILGDAKQRRRGQDFMHHECDEQEPPSSS